MNKQANGGAVSLPTCSVFKQMGECQQGRRSVPADVASPRPREVGGACRIQVLAGARTQETVGGSNEAARSEFRRN